MSGNQGYGLFEVFTRQWLDKTPIHVLAAGDVNVRSIQDHLSRLLNARQGALAHLPDYGLPDIAELYGDLPYTVGSLQDVIAVCIGKFEPRLMDVEVVSLPDDKAKAVLIFEIRATLLNGRRAAFETYLMSEGDAQVVHRQDGN